MSIEIETKNMTIKELGSAIFETQIKIKHLKEVEENLKERIKITGPVPHPENEERYYGQWDTAQNEIKDAPKTNRLLFDYWGKETFLNNVEINLTLIKKIDKGYNFKCFEFLEGENEIIKTTTKKFSWKEVKNNG